jgi:hypothetical protein
MPLAEINPRSMVKRIDANVNRAFSANLSGAPLPWGVAPGYSECRAFGAKHTPKLAPASSFLLSLSKK